MRSILAVFVAILFLGTLAVAQVPTSGNVFFGYSYYRTNLFNIDSSNANGWEATLEGKVLPFVGIVADFDSHYGSESVPQICAVGFGCSVSSVDIHEQNYLFGPRVSVSIGRITPFVEALFGAGHVNAKAAGSDTSFATAIGGGVDYRLIRPVAWRFQGDYVQTRFFSNTQNNLRLSTGIVLRF